MTRVLKPNFSSALRYARRARGVAQEAMDEAAGRTYVSALERGVKQPTIGKVAELAAVLGLHPLTLMAAAYLPKPTPGEASRLFSRVASELADLAAASE